MKTYWRTTRCHIILPEKANLIAIGTLQDLTVYRDRYIGACAEQDDIIDYDFWDYDYYRQHASRFPTLAIDMRLALLRRTAERLKTTLKQIPDLWNRFIENRFHFPEENFIEISGRGGLGFRTEDGQPTTDTTDWLYVPYFGQCKQRRKFLSQAQIDRTEYMRLRHYPDSGEWYLLLFGEVEYAYKQTEPQDRTLMPALAVSFGLDVLATCYEDQSKEYSQFVNVALDERSKIAMKRIAELEEKRKRQIIGTACQMGYDAWDKSFQLRDMSPRDRYTLENGPNYKKTTRVIGRLKKQMANRKYQERHEIAKLISRGDFKYVVLDTTNPEVQRARAPLMNLNDTLYLNEQLEITGLDQLSNEIASACVDRGIPYIRTTSAWRGWTRCSKCLRLKAFPNLLDNGEVKCRFCGHQTLPHVNNAVNLIRYGEPVYLEKYDRPTYG